MENAILLHLLVDPSFIKLTPPRTPQLNGVAERRNRTLLDMVRSMMCQATLLISFWGYALETTAHILNLDCEVFVKREAQDKLEAKSEKYLFFGYSDKSVGYLFYKPKDNVVFVARRGVFLKREMISKEDSGSKIHLEEIQESVDKEPIVNTDTQQEVFYYGFHVEKDKISDSTLTELNEPANYKEEMASPEAAKLVAKGYTQTHRIDYEETFSLVAKIKSIRIMLAIATFHDYEIWQMDVNTTFLNGKLTEDVFMAQPEGFENEKYFKRFGFSRSEDESCIYVKVSRSVEVFLVLYVDDILLIGNDIPALQSVKDWLRKCFAMKDLGDAAYILGIKIYRDRSKHQQNLGEAVTWKSSKQDTMADSTCESEYIAACEASKEAIWMKNFIGDLGVVPTVQDPIEILCDNESAVALTKEPKDHGKSKHIERKYHFVRSKVEEGHVIVKDIRSEDNPADPFTKALAKSKHDEHAKSIGLKDKIEF
ncbi:retrotransposon protein, putative, ty1-copia subclass [Tanacetum coccineum]